MKKTLLFVCLLLLACSFLAGQELTTAGKNADKAKLLLEKVLEIWEKGNFDLIPQLYTPDAVARTSTFPDAFVGHEGIRKWIGTTRTMFPDMVITFDDVVVQDDKIATIWTITGTQLGPLQLPNGVLPPTGRKVRFSGLSIDYLKDGKLVKELVIYNVLEMLLQLGFTLNPPATMTAK
jgi:predicted ester cyclase